jgi:hypothetical protein
METAMKTTNHRNSIGGKPVVNAKRGIKLHISATDTRTGRTKDPGACAAAKAAVREVPNCIAARIHLGRAYLLLNDGKWRRYKTPEALRGEVIAFDRGGKFEPGEYKLMPMSPSDLKPKRPPPYSRSDTNRDSGTSETKQPRKFHVVRGVRQFGANR